MAWSPFDKPIVDSPSAFQVPGPWVAQAPGLCKSCGASIMWAEHPVTYSRHPFDPDGRSHMKSCPHGQMWRERARRRQGGQ